MFKRLAGDGGIFQGQTLNQGAEVEVVQTVTDSAPKLPVTSWEVGDRQGHAAYLQAALEGLGLPST